MSKLVQILLTKQLTVNLGRDDQGEVKTVVLEAGIQEVEQEIAEHWFVKAHSQEITTSDASSHALQVELDTANAAIKSLTAHPPPLTRRSQSSKKQVKRRIKRLLI